MKKPIVGILAHVDAGKTTLSEALLYNSGMIRKMGRVDHQDAFLDHFELEKKRGITIFSKLARMQFLDVDMTLLDTPGHVDFSAETERTLQVLDYAILVVSATDGVQAHTETLWKLLMQYEVPAFLFVNKLDLLYDAGMTETLNEEGSDLLKSEDNPFMQTEKAAKLSDGIETVLSELRTKLDSRIMDFSNPDAVMEDIATNDEEAMEQYLKTAKVDEDTIRGMIAERKIFPVYFGSALKNNGIKNFMEGLNQWFCELSYPEEFGAKVYKIGRDDQGNRLTYLKVTGGELKVKGVLGDEKVDQIRLYSGAKFDLAKKAEAGMICAVTGPLKTYPGEGIGIEAQTKEGVLSPVMTYRMIPPKGMDSLVLLKKVKELEEEDPMLHVLWNEEHQEIHVQIMGKVQLEVLQSLMKERFDVDVTFGTGSIVYKETIAAPVEGVGHFEPLRHYAEVHLLLEPLPQGSGLVFDTEVSEDELDLNWQRLVLTHLEEREHRGVLTGAAITDMRITLVAGKAHIKHTEGGDFRQATYRAVRQGLKSGECILLEPYYAFELTVPNEQIGRTMNDMQLMSGTFLPPETLSDGMTLLKGMVPVSTALDYMSEVHAYTKGRGQLKLSNGGYGPCHNAEEVIEKRGYDSEKDHFNPTGSVFCEHGAGTYIPWDQVRDYMHVQSKALQNDTHFETEEERLLRKADADKRRRGKAASEGFGKELEEIMLREFGPIKRREYGNGNTRYISDGKNVSGEVFQKKYKKKTQKPAENYLLVDGYNIIFAWDELKELAKGNLDAARGRLMDILCDYQGFTKCRLILVFDAYKIKGNPGAVTKYHNIDVIYTKEAETADMYIEKVTRQIGQEHRVRVATSDGLEQMIILGHGAMRVSAREFELEVADVKEKVRSIIEV